MATLPIIIVSGPPCTGKTTLAKMLSQKFSIPYISKDGVKELLFDSLGWSDREWSKKLGLASYDVVYYFSTALLSSGKSFVVESNFKPENDTAKFNDLISRFDCFPIQVLCWANGEVLFERFKKRSESNERHPGHVDTKNYNEFKESLLRGKYDPLDIGGKVIEVDTTDFSAIDYAGLFEKVRIYF